MSLATAIKPHLPYLRRFSRALTGGQQSGDAYVAMLLETLVADPTTLGERQAGQDRPLFPALQIVGFPKGQSTRRCAWTALGGNRAKSPGCYPAQASPGLPVNQRRRLFDR